ncbi:MAG: hypothetical protein ACOCVF_01750 [bacterium]
MVTIPNIPSKLYTSFNEVKFNDYTHTYMAYGKKLISVTTIIHKYEAEFNKDYWSAYKAEEYGMPEIEVIDGWNFLNKKAIIKGSLAHNYAENLFLNKKYDYPADYVNSVFGYDPVKEDYNKTVNHINNFYKASYNKLIPIRTEMVVFDDEYGIGGMVDLLFYNLKAKEWQIWDWKTNKEFTKENKWGNMMSGRLGLLQSCHHEIYSLQLSAYKYIIEKNTGIKLGKSYLVWIPAEYDNYEVIEAKDRQNYVEIMFEEFLNEVA